MDLNNAVMKSGKKFWFENYNSMSLLFGYLHKKHQMRRVTRFLWRLIRKQACGHRVRERIACFPN